jgi:hypothetical protein
MAAPSIGELLVCVVFPCPGLIDAVCLAAAGARRAGTLAVAVMLRVALTFATGH